MSFWNSRHIKVSKKNHRCEVCSKSIAKGKSYYRETGTCNGDFNDYCLCERCHKLITSDNEIWNNSDSNDNELADFREALIESGSIDCPKCGKKYSIDREYRNNMMSVHCTCSSCSYEYDVDLSAENLLGK